MAKGNTAFYIARRYLIAKKGSQAVSFITGLAAFAMMVAVAAMFIIISVFSGLEDLNKDFISNLHADLTLKSTQGKVIPNIQKVTSTLKSENEISHFSKMIEEKVYIDYKNTGEIAYIRGVDSAYVKVNPIDKNIFYGSYPSFKFMNEVIMEAQLNNRLAIPVANDVNVTADLSIAKIYLSIFPQEFRTPIMKEIDENKSFYRNFIGQKMAKQVRIIPELNFYLDTTLDDVERIEKELKGLGDNPIL